MVQEIFMLGVTTDMDSKVLPIPVREMNQHKFHLVLVHMVGLLRFGQVVEIMEDYLF